VYYISTDLGGDDTLHFANSQIAWRGMEVPALIQ